MERLTRGAHDLLIAATTRAAGRTVLTTDAPAFDDLRVACKDGARETVVDLALTRNGRRTAGVKAPSTVVGALAQQPRAVRAQVALEVAADATIQPSSPCSKTIVSFTG